MEQFLSLVGMQAVKLAVRSSIALTSSYALKQYSTFLKTVDDKQLFEELKVLESSLDNKIKIITPAIDLIELRTGQGNSALESAILLTRSIQQRISSLGHKATSLAVLQTSHASIRAMLTEIRALINQIDSSVPLLQLAISASGESLSTSLPETVSPSRMLQASAFLMMADTQFTANPGESVQIGPDFIVSVYMIFKGYCYTGNEIGTESNSHDINNKSATRKPTWQEVLHKARLRLHRMPAHRAQPLNETQMSEKTREYNYSLEILEDRDDGRHHDNDDDQPRPNTADLIPATQISKLFYTNSAAILNIKDEDEASNVPILLIKRESDFNSSSTHATTTVSDEETQRSIDFQLSEECHEYLQSDGNPSHASKPRFPAFPSYLDPEWIALEMYTADVPTSDEQDDSWPESTGPNAENETTLTENTTGSNNISVGFEALCLGKDDNLPDSPPPVTQISTLHNKTIAPVQSLPSGPFRSVTTSLSLLELVIRLTVLQEAQQESHLSIPDHILTCFLHGPLQPGPGQRE